MARLRAGGSLADVVIDIESNPVGPGQLLLYSDEELTLRITDLLDNTGSPISSVPVDDHGRVAQFRLPDDGTSALWAALADPEEGLPIPPGQLILGRDGGSGGGGGTSGFVAHGELIVNAADYGLKASKSAAANATAIHAAQTALLALGGGGTVLIPEGTFNVGPLTRDQRVIFQGKDSATTLASQATSGQWAVDTTGTNNPRLRGGLRDLAITVNVAGANGVRMTSTNRHRLSNVRISGGPSSATRNATIGLLLAGTTGAGTGSAYNDLDNVYVEYCVTGVKLDGGSGDFCNRNELRAVQVQSCDTGMDLQRANTNNIRVTPQACGTGLNVGISAAYNLISIHEEASTVASIVTAATANQNVFTGTTDGGSVIVDNSPSSSWFMTNYFKPFRLRSPQTFEADGAVSHDFGESSGGTSNLRFLTRNDANLSNVMLTLEGGGADNRVIAGKRILAQAGIDVVSPVRIAASGTPGSTSPQIIVGTGSPEGVVTARIASIYMRSDGGTDSALYRKESGTGNTGWVAMAAGGGGGAPAPIYAPKNAATTRNNTTGGVADDPDLVAAVAASSVYKVEAFIVYEATLTADLSITWSVPAGASMVWGPDSLRQAAATQNDTINRGASTSATALFAPGGNGAGNKVMARPIGRLTTAATAGSLTFRWGQAVAEVSDAIVHAGSYLLLTKLA